MVNVVRVLLFPIAAIPLAILFAGDVIVRLECKFSDCEDPQCGDGILKTSSSQAYAFFRRDQYLGCDYPESFAEAPRSGGKVHIVAPATLANLTTIAKPFTITLGDQHSIQIQAGQELGVFDWAHCEINTASGWVWVSFHTRQEEVIDQTNSLTAVDANGVVFLETTIPLPPPALLTASHSSNNKKSNDCSTSPSLVVTYVTTATSFSEYIIHIENNGATDQVLTSAVMDGTELLSSTVTIPAFRHHVFQAATTISVQEASVWTLALETQDISRIGVGGRFPKEVFPIEDWPKSKQCPHPQANNSNFELLRDTLHINTRFLGGTCDADPFEIANNADSFGYYVLPSESLSTEGVLTNPASVLAIATADEIDGSYDNLQDAWNRVLDRRTWYPHLTTFQGGHVSRILGAFAGIADMQGVDYYVACCAPHITNFFTPVPIQGAYDYALMARLNTLPQPMWSFAQAFGNWDTVINEGEITAQIGSILAAGSKAVLLFQSDVNQRTEPAWDATGHLLASVSLLGEYFRVSDVGPRVSNSDEDDSLVRVLYGPKALLLVAVNTKACSYDSRTCYVPVVDCGKKWEFWTHIIRKIRFPVPSGFVLDRVQEAVNGVLVAPTQGARISFNSDTLKVENLVMDKKLTTRIFVFYAK